MGVTCAVDETYHVLPALRSPFVFYFRIIINIIRIRIIILFIIISIISIIIINTITTSIASGV